MSSGVLLDLCVESDPERNLVIQATSNSDSYSYTCLHVLCDVVVS